MVQTRPIGAQVCKVLIERIGGFILLLLCGELGEGGGELGGVGGGAQLREGGGALGGGHRTGGKEIYFIKIMKKNI